MNSINKLSLPLKKKPIVFFLIWLYCVLMFRGRPPHLLVLTTTFQAATVTPQSDALGTRSFLVRLQKRRLTMTMKTTTLAAASTMKKPTTTAAVAAAIIAGLCPPQSCPLQQHQLRQHHRLVLLLKRSIRQVSSLASASQLVTWLPRKGSLLPLMHLPQVRRLTGHRMGSMKSTRQLLGQGKVAVLPQLLPWLSIMTAVMTRGISRGGRQGTPHCRLLCCLMRSTATLEDRGKEIVGFIAASVDEPRQVLIEELLFLFTCSQNIITNSDNEWFICLVFSVVAI